MIKIVTIISRLAIGLLFIFSGFVKCVDPVGGAIKFNEYFTAFGIEWLSGGAVFLSIMLSSVELVLGCTLIFGLYRKITAWLTLAFLSAFTLLTVVIYLTNPVQDCGCFGDAVKLSNGATLLKNIISLIIFIPFFKSVKKLEWITNDNETFTKFVSIVALVLFIPIYSINNLPFLDFLPYKIGVNITDAMSVPENAEMDEYKTTLLYKNKIDGLVKEFSVDDTTWYDQTKWEYVDTKTELTKKGYTPPITSFNIFDKDKTDVTGRILSDKKTIALFIINDKKISSKVIKNISETINNLRSNNITPIFITRFEIDWLSGVLYSVDNNSVFEVYNADDTLLKSIIRTDFGLVMIKDGTIISKHNLNKNSIKYQ